MIEYTGRKIERRSKDRKPLTNQFAKELARAVNRGGNVVLINVPAANKPKDYEWELQA